MKSFFSQSSAFEDLKRLVPIFFSNFFCIDKQMSFFFKLSVGKSSLIKKVNMHPLAQRNAMVPRANLESISHMATSVVLIINSQSYSNI